MGGSSFLLFFSLGVYAQDTTIKSLPSITITPATKVPNEVTKTFNASFQDAVDPAWYKIDQRYMVRFLTNDQKNQSLYKKNGELIYYIHYGFEQNLPSDIRKMIKSSYVDYKITMAIFVNQDKRNIWVVNLEDKSKYIVVRVEDGELEEVENMNRTM
jgi:hypothetical protein